MLIIYEYFKFIVTADVYSKWKLLPTLPTVRGEENEESFNNFHDNNTLGLGIIIATESILSRININIVVIHHFDIAAILY